MSATGRLAPWLVNIDPQQHGRIEMRHPMRHFALTCAAILWMGAATGADTPQLGPVPSWVKPYAWRDDGVATEAAVKLLLKDEQFDFTAEAMEVYSEAVAKIQTPQGLGAMGTLAIPWNPATDTVTVHKVHIVRGEQVIDALEGEEPFTILRRENNLEYASLDGVLTAVVQPAGLQVGDIVNLALTIRRSNPVFGGHVEHASVLPVDVPVGHARIRARWPASLPVRWTKSDALPPVSVRNRDSGTELWLELHDLQPLVQPEGAPMRFAVERRLDFSSFHEWSDVAERLAPLYDAAATLEPDSALHAEIERIKAQSPDPLVRAAAALRLVQDQVRYVFLGMNDGGLVPATADLTWTRRFGDCKAKSVLLVTLLRALDIPADAVAVNSVFGDAVQGRLPMIGAFDHVIVRAVIDGREYWLDGARTGDRRLDEIVTPPYSVGLPLVARDAALVPIMPEPFTEPLKATSIRIDATEGIRVPAPFQVETVYRSDAATALQLRLSPLTPRDLDRVLRDYWSEEYPFVDIDTVAAKFDKDSARTVLSMTGRARMDWSGGRYTTDGLTLGYEADFERPPGPHADAPFAVSFPAYGQVSETILLPYEGERFRVEGEDIEQTVAGVEYRRKASIENGVFNAVATTRSVAAEFPASEAAAARESLRQMAKKKLYVRAPADYLLTDKEMAAELAKVPTTAAAYVARGKNRFDRREYADSIEDFDKALALEPKHADALAERGIAHLLLNEHDLARKDFDAAFALDPRDPVVARGRGLLAAREGNFEQAIEHYSRSLDLDPGSRFALEQRAAVYARLRQFDKAHADLDALAKADPQDVSVYVARAGLYMMEGKRDEAAKQAEAALAARPDAPEVLAMMGQLLALTGDRQQAVAALDRVVELEPSVQAYLARANARDPLDDAGRLNDIEAALKLNPKALQALAMRAELHGRAGRHAEAIQAYTAALDVERSADLLTARGLAHHRNGDAARAARDFEAARAIAMTPNDQNNVCYLLASANLELPMALELCQAAAHSQPEAPEIQDSLGFVLLRLGRYEESIKAYDTALALAEDLPLAQYGRGIARLRAGDQTGGDEDLQAAIAVDPQVANQFSAMGVTP
jgi:tetratricopeptide (TPR) repeat protein